MENWHRGHASPPAPRIHWPAAWRIRTAPALHPASCGPNRCSRSPCCIQSKQAEDLVAQFHQLRIAAVPGIGTVHRDVGLDARRAIAEDDDAIGEKHRFLDIMG